MKPQFDCVRADCGCVVTVVEHDCRYYIEAHVTLSVVCASSEYHKEHSRELAECITGTAFITVID